MPFSALPPRALAQLAAVTDGAIRIGPLLGIPGLLRELGQDPAAVFREAGVDPSLFDDPELLVGFPAAGQLLARCAAATGYPHFGRLLGQRTGLDVLGLVGTLVEHSPDVGKALQNLVVHLHLHDRGAVPSMTIEDAAAFTRAFRRWFGTTPAAWRKDRDRGSAA